MQVLNTKLCLRVIVIAALISVLLVSTVASVLMSSVVIGNVGRISLLNVVEGKTSQDSEMRGMFLHNWRTTIQNHALVAQTCREYGINTIIIEAFWPYMWDNTNNIGKVDTQLRNAVNIYRSQGFNVHVLVILGLNPGSSLSEFWTVHYNGGQLVNYNWLDFSKNKTEVALTAVAKILATEYDIQGITFDYIRWDLANMPMSTEAQARFKAETGRSDARFPTDVIEGGKYFTDFVAWRANMITNAVRYMREEAIKYNPNLEFSSSPWTAIPDAYGSYWYRWNGQHTADWVDKGYLDFACTMHYSDYDDEAAFKSHILESSNYYFGGEYGKIRFFPFITTGTGSRAISVSDFANAVEWLFEAGADGWVIWRYGGPGIASAYQESYFDVRPYLQELNNRGLMEPIFSVRDLTAVVNGGEATISWTTTTETTTVLEYRNGEIFSAYYPTNPYGLTYKAIRYNADQTNKIIDSTLTITHSITIPYTSNTRFRIIQSTQSETMATNEFLITDFL